MLPNQVGRRSFLRRGGLSLGSMALGNLLARDGVGLRAAGGGGTPGALGALHHTPRVKRVIWLYMAGGMSHLDTFDHKPTLVKLDGQPMPESVTKGKQIAQLQGSALKVFAPQHPFKEYGQSGQKISTVFPLLGEKCADQICLIRSLSTDAINHDPAHTFMNTGTMIAGRPAMGSWVLYGLGAETQDLPGFIVLVSTGRYGQKQPIAARQWHSGCLPGRVQGVELRGTGDPVLYVRNPPGVDNAGQRGVVDAAQALNRLH